MTSFIRKQLTYTNAAVTAALVFAMAGGALAAGAKHHAKHHKKGGVVITSTKQISKSVLTALKGNVGPVGPQGPAGVNGKDGVAGVNGKDGVQGPQGQEGKEGKEGPPGVNGKDGVSVTSASIPPGASEPCGEAGGVAYTSASGTENVCNGKEGSPWTAGGTLPSGKTETGAWALSASAEGPFNFTAISFTLELKKALEEASQVEYVTSSTGTTNCKGTITAPTAAAGFLCVYQGGILNMKEPAVHNLGGGPGASKTGALVQATAEAGEPRFAFGSWAVTEAEAK